MGCLQRQSTVGQLGQSTVGQPGQPTEQHASCLLLKPLCSPAVTPCQRGLAFWPWAKTQEIIPQNVPCASRVPEVARSWNLELTPPPLSSPLLNGKNNCFRGLRSLDLWHVRETSLPLCKVLGWDDQGPWAGRVVTLENNLGPLRKRDNWSTSGTAWMALPGAHGGGDKRWVSFPPSV